MNQAEKAKYLVNDCYYQPLTEHLKLNNNSKEMWDYAKRCAKIACDTALDAINAMEDPTLFIDGQWTNATAFWTTVKNEINKL